MTNRFPESEFENGPGAPDFWDSPPPEEDWEPPSEMQGLEEFIASLAASAELPDPAQMVLPLEEPVVEAPFVPAAFESDTPFDGIPALPPQTSWERYLASFPVEPSPEAQEQQMIQRAELLNLVDARFVGLERLDEQGTVTGYEIGCLEVSVDPVQGGQLGRYLEVAQVTTAEEAGALYHDLQGRVNDGQLPVYAVHDYAGHVAQEYENPVLWRDATANDFHLYNQMRGLDGPAEHSPTAAPPEPSPAFDALSAIGIQATDFDPDHDPPPFYDPETGTAYWIGIFQPDLTDSNQCVTSVLSLGRNPESGQLEAQLAPCVPGSWDKAYESGQHLLDVMARDGIDACFLAAESMAIATDQRDLWENGRGVPLEQGYVEQAADYTRDAFDVSL